MWPHPAEYQDLGGITGYTVEFYVYPTSLANSFTLAKITNLFEIYFNTILTGEFFVDGGASIVQDTAPLFAAEAWQHIHCSFENSQQAGCLIDGSEVVTVPVVGNI